MKRAFFSTIIVFIAAIDGAQAQRVTPIVHLPVQGISTPVIVVPQGMATPSLPDLPDAPVVVVPQGPVVLVPVNPPIADEGPDLDCTVAEERCASLGCYPLPNTWASHKECLTRFCEIHDQNCIEALVERLE